MLLVFAGASAAAGALLAYVTGRSRAT
jgi:hypothetical protein